MFINPSQPSVQNMSYASLKPVNLKPFYIKPYLTQESEIRIAEAEMEKLCQMGILRRWSREFLSPIMLIKMSHSGGKLNNALEYRLVMDFKYLNSHLPDIKFSYAEIKHGLHKIGRNSSRVYSVLYLRFIVSTLLRIANITLVVVSPQDCSGLNVSPAYFTSLMKHLLHELPPEIREYIDCIMHDIIILTPDVKTNKKVLKGFMLMLKKYCMLPIINKVHTFRSKVKYIGLLLSSKDKLPIITTLGSHVKAISTLQITLTALGIKSFIVCVIYLAQFLPNGSEIIKLINDILKNCNKVNPADKIQPLPL